MPYTKLMEQSGFKLLHDGQVMVFLNPSGEVFIEHHNGVTLRVSDVPNGLIATASGYVLQPTSANGVNAFSVEYR